MAARLILKAVVALKWLKGQFVILKFEIPFINFSRLFFTRNVKFS